MRRRAARVDASEIIAAVRQCGDLDTSASMLGLKRCTMQRRMKEFGLTTRGILRDRHIGQKYNRWTVVHVFVDNERPKALCRCDCGTEKVNNLSSVVHGTTKSCGCFRVDSTIARFTKHGNVGSPEYVIWSGMKQRCLDPNADNYRYYGGKGVAVCSRWADDFGAFLADMGPKPSPKHSLDRINPFGNYEPGNCRWVTWDVQVANKRANYEGV